MERRTRDAVTAVCLMLQALFAAAYAAVFADARFFQLRRCAADADAATMPPGCRH